METDDISKIKSGKSLIYRESKMNELEYGEYRDKAFLSMAIGEMVGFVRGFRNSFEMF